MLCFCFWTWWIKGRGRIKEFVGLRDWDMWSRIMISDSLMLFLIFDSRLLIFDWDFDLRFGLDGLRVGDQRACWSERLSFQCCFFTLNLLIKRLRQVIWFHLIPSDSWCVWCFLMFWMFVFFGPKPWIDSSRIWWHGLKQCTQAVVFMIYNLMITLG